jgi:hypothetical protein
MKEFQQFYNVLCQKPTNLHDQYTVGGICGPRQFFLGMMTSTNNCAVSYQSTVYFSHSQQIVDRRKVETSLASACLRHFWAAIG